MLEIAHTTRQRRFLETFWGPEMSSPGPELVNCSSNRQACVAKGTCPVRMRGNFAFVRFEPCLLLPKDRERQLNTCQQQYVRLDNSDVSQGEAIESVQKGLTRRDVFPS